MLNTGGDQSIISQAHSFSIAPGVSQPRLQFYFGFGTDETFSPNTFLDSFTVTVQGTNDSATAVYLTADPSGLNLAPETPGGITIPRSWIVTQPVEYPSLSPLVQNRFGFAVTAELPEEFVGQEVNVFFDLFDNQNGIQSQAWFDQLAIVPEPNLAPLTFLGFAVCWYIRRRLHS